MAQKRIANNLEALQSDISTCRAVQTQLGNTFKRSIEEVNALTGMWEGSAHDVFLQQFRTDAENMQKLLDFVDSYLKDLEDARQRYARCESDVSERIRTIII